ncbi:hypothetical protein BXZ70DRAFT_1009238 [Cristinia sonorae]|uniref:SH3 domain-binding glutamic acid-rich protein n=1 Tax=Cristinia sonorae TaxID=1940300 RepID=A0A8K0UNK3_9AGAR|nr:hypothetical protein BXZ70DRAFT_1009238 [Cristinia sonorae]
MAPPPIQLFMTTIASQPALRQRQETLLRVLQVKKIPFISYDLASDEDAKKMWRRKAPVDKQQLPGILIGGEFPGTYAEFEDAVEYGELETFLRLNEDYVPSEFSTPAPEEKPVGVPGAYSPNQMNPKHRPSLSPSPSGSPLKNKGKVVSTNEELAEYGIHDVELTEDDLSALMQELGMGGADASDLAKGLSGRGDKTTPSIKVERPEEDVVETAKVAEEKADKPVVKEAEAEVKEKAKVAESESQEPKRIEPKQEQKEKVSSETKSKEE